MCASNQPQTDVQLICEHVPVMVEEASIETDNAFKAISYQKSDRSS
jgi:hypothetical protein